ncbi:MAG: T9SS type A sorting domain-containing protein [Candidatus Kapabacteria bacterium]|nr:T9SS type A sorting domain-containing protein [Candidatus Kapabacteria bacterium]
MLTANSGSFSDRSSGDVYGDNLDCHWLIQPTNGRRVTLTFSRFNTEQNVDFVTVYDGPTINDRVLGRFTGTTVPNYVTGSGGSLLVRFTTDPFVGSSGWAVNYITEPESTINPSQIRWQFVNILGNRRIDCFASQENILFVGTSSGIFRSPDNGSTWALANSSLVPNVGGLAANNTHVFALVGQELFSSNNLGNSWTKTAMTTATLVLSFQNAIYVLSNGNILRSGDNGNTWQNLSMQSMVRNVNNLIINDGRFFAFASGGVFLSRDMGSSWQLISTSYGGRAVVLGNDIFALRIQSLSGSSGFVNRCNEISNLMVNRNLSTTWVNLVEPNNNPISLFAFGTSNILVGGCQRGTAFSNNSGLTWSLLSNSPGDASAFFLHNQTIYAATPVGLLRAPLTVTSSVQEKSEQQYDLQVYPNPVEESATLSYTIPRSSHVKIDIVNSLGQSVTNVHNSELPAGNHTLQLKMDSFVSGTYFIRIFTNGFSATKSIRVFR